MGCFGNREKATEQKTIEEAEVSDSPVGSQFRKYSSQMLSDLHYLTFLDGKVKIIKEIMILDKSLGEEGSRLLSILLPELTYLNSILLQNNSIGYPGPNKLAENLSRAIRLIFGYELESINIPESEYLFDINNWKWTKRDFQAQFKRLGNNNAGNIINPGKTQSLRLRQSNSSSISLIGCSKGCKCNLKLYLTI